VEKYMAVQIIIDGYNLIGTIDGLQGNLESKRRRLVQQLALYQARKGHPVTVVFDGWRSGSPHEVEEKADGITVVYSQQGEKADAVVVRIARRLGSGCVVVTSDREVRNAVARFGAAAIYAGEFNSILRRLEAGLESEEEPESFSVAKTGNPKRLSKIERRRRQRLKKLKV